MENLRGSLLMVLAMAGFALEDMLIKLMAGTMPMGQVITLIGLGGTVMFAALTRAKGERIWSPMLLSRPVMLRNLGELIASLGFVSAIVLTSLSTASAILQATPLAVTLGAALFLGEPVGWRRWSAITVGFVGVLCVIQPGMAGFTPASLLGVVAVAGLALRDLAVRHVPAHVTGAQLSVWAFAILVPAGPLLMVFSGTVPVAPGPLELGWLGAAFLSGWTGYYAIVAATRTGEVSVVVPFRYTRLVFAMILGGLVFGERSDALTLSGGGTDRRCGALHHLARGPRAPPPRAGADRVARSVRPTRDWRRSIEGRRAVRSRRARIGPVERPETGANHREDRLQRPTPVAPWPGRVERGPTRLGVRTT